MNNDNKTVQPKEPWLETLGRKLRDAFEFALGRLDNYRSARERARLELARQKTELAEAEARRRDAQTRAGKAWMEARRAEEEEKRRTIAVEADAKSELLRSKRHERRKDWQRRADIWRTNWAFRLEWLKRFTAWVKEEVADHCRRKAEADAEAESRGETVNNNPFFSFLALVCGSAMLVLSFFWARAAVINPTGPWGAFSLTCFFGSLLTLYASWRLRRQPFGKALKQTFVNPVTIPAYLVGLGLILRAWQ